MDSSEDASGGALTLKDQMEYGMKHFQFIADQRMKSFQFYAVLLAASVAATLALVEKPFNPVSYLVCGTYHILIAALFLFIERRNVHLLKLSRNAVQAVEAQRGWPLPLRISHIDSAITSQGIRRLGSFRFAFVYAYACQALFGAGIVYCGAFVHHQTKRPDLQPVRVVLSDGTTVDYLRKARRKSGNSKTSVNSDAANMNMRTAPRAGHPDRREDSSARSEASIIARNNGTFIP